MLDVKSLRCHTMARLIARSAGFLLVAIAIIVGVVFDRVIEAIAVAAVLLAVSVYVDRFFAEPQDEVGDGRSRDLASGGDS